MTNKTNEAIQQNKEGWDPISIYGDGWYDGFLAAQKINHSGEDLDIYHYSDVLTLSEHAEVNQPAITRNRWRKTPPTQQGMYWHWSGNTDDAPLAYYIGYSCSKHECFVQAGQLGLTTAIWCSEFGGLWANIAEPSIKGNVE